MWHLPLRHTDLSLICNTVERLNRASMKLMIIDINTTLYHYQQHLYYYSLSLKLVGESKIFLKHTIQHSWPTSIHYVNLNDNAFSACYVCIFAFTCGLHGLFIAVPQRRRRGSGFQTISKLHRVGMVATTFSDPYRINE